jgi:hypothetical protein
MRIALLVLLCMVFLGYTSGKPTMKDIAAMLEATRRRVKLQKKLTHKF